ncbi:MAG: polysaccharide deacetylase family protein [Phycisphaerae bacterium]|nr:polysaccharide deacetylase family protein [Phycisphaerae bacterium]
MGADDLYVRATQTRGAVILMYHSVAGKDAAAWIDPANHLPPEVFERHLSYLNRHRKVVPLSNVLQALQRGDCLSAGTVSITFDDGYLDTLSTAAPLLARFSFPATVYLATGYISRGQSQWIDQLYGAFVSRTQDDLDLGGAGGAVWNLGVTFDRSAAYAWLKQRLLTGNLADRNALLAEVEGQLRPYGMPPRLTMTWDDVRTLRARYPAIELGVHTRDHLDLTAHSNDVVAAELAGCIEDFRVNLGFPPRHFSFPYSRANRDLSRMLADVGLESAAIACEDPVVKAAADRYCLPRIAAPCSTRLLGLVTSGAYPDLPRRLVGRA